MTSETAYFLDKARRVLMEADSILAINIYDVAGRMAYLAGFQQRRPSSPSKPQVSKDPSTVSCID
jgi:hypothetical protein